MKRFQPGPAVAPAKSAWASSAIQAKRTLIRPTASAPAQNTSRGRQNRAMPRVRDRRSHRNSVTRRILADSP